MNGGKTNGIFWDIYIYIQQIDPIVRFDTPTVFKTLSADDCGGLYYPIGWEASSVMRIPINQTV